MLLPTSYCPLPTAHCPLLPTAHCFLLSRENFSLDLWMEVYFTLPNVTNPSLNIHRSLDLHISFPLESYHRHPYRWYRHNQRSRFIVSFTLRYDYVMGDTRVIVTCVIITLLRHTSDDVTSGIITSHRANYGKDNGLVNISLH